MYCHYSYSCTATTHTHVLPLLIIMYCRYSYLCTVATHTYVLPLLPYRCCACTHTCTHTYVLPLLILKYCRYSYLCTATTHTERPTYEFLLAPLKWYHLTGWRRKSLVGVPARVVSSLSRPQAGSDGSIRPMPTTPAPSPPPLARLGGAGEADLLVVAGGAAPPGGQRLRVPAQIK